MIDRADRHPRGLVYLDYNATAPLRPEVRSAMAPLLLQDEGFGNASSVHWAGREARRRLEAARTRLAELTQRRPSEVIFTSGGSEANNLAIQGLLDRDGPRRLVVSAIEHPAVLRAADRVARLGVDVVKVGVNAEGQLDTSALEEALAIPTALVSVMAVNNETGVVQPVEEVVDRAHRAGAKVHVDAVQAAGRVPLPTGADLVTLSAHKLGGPKGIGALLTRRDLPLQPLVVGGAQERGLRAGTEPVALAVGMAEAFARALEAGPAEAVRLGALRDSLEAQVQALEGVRILGKGAPRVSQTSCMLFEGVEADALLPALDLEGFAVSSGSACSSGSLEPSHVLLAMGVPAARALGAVRISLGWASKPEDVERFLALLPDVLRRVRAAARYDGNPGPPGRGT